MKMRNEIVLALSVALGILQEKSTMCILKYPENGYIQCVPHIINLFQIVLVFLLRTDENVFKSDAA